MSLVTGGCSCGAIRFECDAEAVASFNCHCKSCRQYSGAPYWSASIFPSATFQLTSGEISWNTQTGDNGGVIHRGFCASCGSPVYNRLDRLPHVIGIPVGSMDDSSMHVPKMDLYVSQALSWVVMNSEIPKFDLGLVAKS